MLKLETLRMKLRPLLLTLHRYAGLLATLPLILLGISGAMVAFEGEIDRSLNPGFWTVHPQSQTVPWQAIIDAAHSAYPTDAPTLLALPPSPEIAPAVSLKGGLSVTVNPHTGNVLGARRSGDMFIAHLHGFHKNLRIGPWGSRINGAGALLCVGLSISGLFLWWKRRTVRIKWSATWWRVNFDAHHAAGILGLLPWLLLGLTGAAIAFESVVRPALYHLTSSTPPTPPPLRSKPLPGAKPLTADAALDAAAAALPGARAVILWLPNAPTGAYNVFMKFPEDRTPAGRSRVAIDQFSGAILWIENSRATTTGTALVEQKPHDPHRRSVRLAHPHPRRRRQPLPGRAGRERRVDVVGPKARDKSQLNTY